MPPELTIDIHTLDLTKVIADKEAIRKVNPQRYEMEQLDAIVYIDPVLHILAGYKDVRADEFWCRGHIPGFPLFPGVLLCEAAAQLCSFYLHRLGLMKDSFIGFGGMEDVRFRGAVRPGDRLVLVGKAAKMNRRQSTCDVQGFVDGKMVFHGLIIAVPVPRPGED
jgi:3-hydroxyacyl-[acyl-carrier-protein] dehydratase